ncbi:hypothetical protein EDB87DRAFT_1581999 [Lactarius vividus]|nr:hypothetical protein EDB87DRAFT_1581999 [Lactarius vividus]
MPVELFLSNFVPQAPNTRPTATITFTHSAVSENENQIASIITLVDAPSHTFLRFLQLIEDAGLCPNLRFINTTSCIATNLKPDISIYSGIDRNGPWTCASNPPPPEWRAVDLWIENKNQNNDVFRDLEQMKRETTAKSDLRGHIRWSKDAYRVSGQLIAYTSAIHRSQFRVFSFSVVLFGNIGRLLRWDRSGVIYTEPFNWTTQPDTLFKFLWKLNFLSDVKRGYDTTVTSVREDEAEAALSKLRTYQGLENVAKADLHKFLVRDDHTLNGQIKYYIAPSAVWDSEAHLGRSTFGYIAYDLETTNLVYLKDFWCTDCDGIQKEGDVYRELHDAHVPHIARLGLAGDVPLLPECGRTDSPAVQRTMTQQFVEGCNWCPGQPRVDPYVHYRLVLETLGSPLNTFKSTWELCEVIRDAITDGSGILIDWDLSKKVVKDGCGKQRQHSRMGTWQFISIAHLQSPSIRPHEVSDDLESFFWVLLYMVAKCRSVGKINLSQEMQNVFDQSDDMDDNGIIRGGRGKLHYLVETPCKDIIEELRSLFNNLYCHVQPLADTAPLVKSRIKSKRDRDERVQDAVKKLRSSEVVLAIINEHLESKWDVSNDGSDHKVRFHADPGTSRNRRKCKAEDDNGKDFNERRSGQFPPSSTQASHSRDMLRLQ